MEHAADGLAQKKKKKKKFSAKLKIHRRTNLVAGLIFLK
jgi:hypothetical protein